MTNRSECLILIAEIPKEPSSISKADGPQAEELCSTINLCTCSKKLKWQLVCSLDRLLLLLCVSHLPFCGYLLVLKSRKSELKFQEFKRETGNTL